MKKFFTTILTIAFGICTPFIMNKCTVDKHIREIKKENFGQFLNQFYGQPVTIDDIKLEKSKDKKNTYIGDVIVRRKGIRYTRPVEISFTEGHNENNYTYGLDLQKYINRKDYLEEDAETFFYNLIKKDPEMSSLSLINARYTSPGVVRCAIRTKTGEEFMADLHFRVEHSVNGPLISYQLTEAK